MQEIPRLDQCQWLSPSGEASTPRPIHKLEAMAPVLAEIGLESFVDWQGSPLERIGQKRLGLLNKVASGTLRTGSASLPCRKNRKVITLWGDGKTKKQGSFLRVLFLGWGLFKRKPKGNHHFEGVPEERHTHTHTNGICPEAPKWKAIGHKLKACR